MELEHLEVLKEITLIGGIKSEELHSEYFKNRFDDYPEDIDDIVKDLLKEGNLDTTSENEIIITQKGRNRLKKDYGGIILTGNVTSGLEKGMYYMKRKAYIRQFREKLNIDPFEGTLNIKLGEDSISKFEKLKDSKGIKIEGFKENEKEFGELTVYPAELGGIECGLIIPSRSNYERTAEIISSKKLREKLNLQDGDFVQILVKPW